MSLLCFVVSTGERAECGTTRYDVLWDLYLSAMKQSAHTIFSYHQNKTWWIFYMIYIYMLYLTALRGFSNIAVDECQAGCLYRHKINVKSMKIGMNWPWVSSFYSHIQKWHVRLHIQHIAIVVSFLKNCHNHYNSQLHLTELVKISCACMFLSLCGCESVHMHAWFYDVG